MSNSYDVIILGLGAMGSATAYHLARRGERVLGLERFRPGHSWGSSHGDSRIIREMYFEHPLYVPLVRRSYQLWEELGQEAGVQLLCRTGGLMLGPPEGALVAGSRRSADTYGIPCEVLDADEIHRRFAPFRPPADLIGVWDARAGFVRPEECVRAHLDLARRAGADLRFAEPATDWRPDGDGVRVTSHAGSYRAGRLLITAGAWTPQLLPGLDLPLVVERQVLFWFEPPAGDGAYDPDRFPIYAYEYAPGCLVYGLPRLQLGLKAAVMHQGELADRPERIRRDVGPGEAEPLRRALREVLPGVGSGEIRRSTVCLFTNTPDSHFLIDFHPEHPQVLISSPCSGHGFKFSSAIGEVQADLLTRGRSAFDLSPFSLARFAER